MGKTGQTKDQLLTAMLDLIWIGSYAGTSVDDICTRANVHKGSFYHHFESKSDLAYQAMASGWEDYRGEMDRLFSVTKPALVRLVDWLVYLRQDQEALTAEHGRVPGCPVHSIGSELGGKEDALHDLLKTMHREYLRYIASAVRDGALEGALTLDDTEEAARLVFFYVEGLLAHARIWNDLGELDQMETGVRQLLGNPDSWPDASSAVADLSISHAVTTTS